MNPMWQKFLERVASDPQDDTVRHIAADWLDDNGESERAEFIRVQLELASPGLQPLPRKRGWEGLGTGSKREEAIRRKTRRMKLRKRAVQLLHKAEDNNYVEWFWPFSKRLKNAWWQFKRGFVEAVECEEADWLKHGRVIVRFNPIVSVCATDKYPLSHDPESSFTISFGSYYGWALNDMKETEPERINERLFRKMRDGLKVHVWNGTWRLFDTEEEAAAAYSDACLRLARGQ
jgi:uncharacterized protein (TIGR02996 family)